MKIKKVGVYCGSRWYRLRDWKTYLKLHGLVRRMPGKGFSIGPILFWDGK